MAMKWWHAFSSRTHFPVAEFQIKIFWHSLSPYVEGDIACVEEEL
jgi:hypothetical protein